MPITHIPERHRELWGDGEMVGVKSGGWLGDFRSAVFQTQQGSRPPKLRATVLGCTQLAQDRARQNPAVGREKHHHSQPPAEESLVSASWWETVDHIPGQVPLPGVVVQPKLDVKGMREKRKLQPGEQRGEGGEDGYGRSWHCVNMIKCRAFLQELIKSLFLKRLKND